MQATKWQNAYLRQSSSLLDQLLVFNTSSIPAGLTCCLMMNMPQTVMHTAALTFLQLLKVQSKGAV